MPRGFSGIAALLADPTREAMLAALADGSALPAGRLAQLAGITPQSASGHLRKLLDGGVVSVWTQGRFRYFRLADERVAVALEALAGLARPRVTPAVVQDPRSAKLAAARCCYNHMAGSLGVALACALAKRAYIKIDGDAVALTRAGSRWAEEFGFAARATSVDRREVRLCLDWTERRFHLAGRFPGGVLQFLLETGHLVRQETRVLCVTPSGKLWFRGLGIEA
ncbi:MAG: helix-turn-helix transcriptional regulator [Nevskia sp.]|nr:helix-turn-helix transcriptional regulator [Nevskia sp.]